MFGFKRRRRERLRRQPFPYDWIEILRENVRYYRYLPPEDREELHGHVQVLLGEKNFEGCGGLELADEVRLTVAGQAAALLLHRETDYFPQLRSILIYPDAFLVPADIHEAGDDIVQGEDIHLGESWGLGAVVLSWRHVLRGTRDAKDGQNVVLHEFAHQLDEEDGVSNGTPLLDDEEAYTTWAEVLSGAYEKLWHDVEQNRRTLIDTYGASDPAEFFAVITECFFERPAAMHKQHPGLYEVLMDFYRQDPEAIFSRPPS
ncbi:MAG: zinc-dependent peptidase [Candidatus Hydrogenedentes bacterium]|nr:zinc-dependent peptidase [Candidatus Hydrogenedentota bacterium]